MIGYIGIFKKPDEIQVHFCFREEAPGGAIGDSMRIVRPGESLYGISYDDLLKHGEGAMEFEPPKRRTLPPRFHQVGKPGDAFILPGSKP
jgi:hypothetical protein